MVNFLNTFVFRKLSFLALLKFQLEYFGAIFWYFWHSGFDAQTQPKMLLLKPTLLLIFCCLNLTAGSCVTISLHVFTCFKLYHFIISTFQATKMGNCLSFKSECLKMKDESTILNNSEENNENRNNQSV